MGGEDAGYCELRLWDGVGGDWSFVGCVRVVPGINGVLDMYLIEIDGNSQLDFLKSKTEPYPTPQNRCRNPENQSHFQPTFISSLFLPHRMS